MIWTFILNLTCGQLPGRMALLILPGVHCVDLASPHVSPIPGLVSLGRFPWQRQRQSGGRTAPALYKHSIQVTSANNPWVKTKSHSQSQNPEPRKLTQPLQGEEVQSHMAKAMNSEREAELEIMNATNLPHLNL